MTLPWADLEVFLAVAETRSFSAAARRLGVTQPTVSRRIAALEESLGRALFQRNVEGARLTSEGERLLPAAEQMARWAAEVERSIETWSDTAEGTVRIAAPPGLAFDLLVPFARELRTSLPRIQLELLTGIEHVDLSRGQADIALRTRRPAQSDLEVVFAGQADLGVFVAPAYACRLERLPCPVPLAALDWITWSYPNEHLPPRKQLEQLIPNFRPVFASNDYLAQLRALTLGLGAMILGRTQHPDQCTGPLYEVRVDLPLPKTEFFLVCAKTMRWVPRVQAVLQELRAKMLAVEGVREAPL